VVYITGEQLFPEILWMELINPLFTDEWFEGGTTSY